MKWSGGELEIQVGHNISQPFYYSRFGMFLRGNYSAIQNTRMTQSGIMGLFDALILDDTPLRLRNIAIGNIGVTYDDPSRNIQSTHVTMYNVDDDKPCALDESVRRRAADKIVRAASLWLATLRTRRAMRNVLSEVLFAPPHSFHPLFPGGVGYTESKIEFLGNAA
jgi:hypothetical protein